MPSWVWFISICFFYRTGSSHLMYLLGSPVESPQPLPRSTISGCSPQVSCMSGAPDSRDPTRSVMMRFPCLVCTSPPPLDLLLVLLQSRVVTVMMKFQFCVSHAVPLRFCAMVMLQFLSCAPVFLASPPPPPLLLVALNLSCRLAAAALSGMVNTNLLLLLLAFPPLSLLSLSASRRAVAIPLRVCFI
jgi:hypothetical protein